MKKKAKVKTVYNHPTDEQLRQAMAEIAPIKEEMESWMGCKEFTLSCITLHATVEDLIDYTKKLNTECIPAWFETNKELCSFMTDYLTDVEVLLKMVRDLKLVRPHEDNIHIENR